VSARFGRDLPAINGGLHWRVYRTEQNGIPRIVKEDKGPTPPSCCSGRLCRQRRLRARQCDQGVQVRADTIKDVFEIPAGGLRIEGRVGDAKIPPGQISFDLYKGSQFEPGDSARSPRP